MLLRYADTARAADTPLSLITFDADAADVDNIT